MRILDNQGRLFGKLSILDVGAALVILVVLFGIFFYPGTAGSIAQVGAKEKPVEIDVIIRGLSTSNPEVLIKDFKDTKQLNIIVRNQPSGKVDVKSVEVLPRTVPVPQPDGKVLALPDPRPEVQYYTDLMLTVGAKAQVTENGPVIGTSKLKIGTPIEMEGLRFNVTGGIVDVRIQG